MSACITAAAMQGRRKSLPDTRLVATTLHGRTGTSRYLIEQHHALSDQVAIQLGAQAGYRADQASIGERLSAVPGLRCLDKSSIGERLSVVLDMRCLNIVGEA